MSRPIDRFRQIRFVLAVLATCACSCGGGGGGGANPPLHPFEHFMGVSGGQFSDGFTFVGANLDPWRFITSVGEVYSRDEIRAWVSGASSATGAKVMRMHMNGGAFEPKRGTYNEAAFRQLDDLVAACVENHMYLVIALRDYLWSPWPASAYDPYWYEGGGTKEDPNKEAILNDATAKAAFKNFIYKVLNRKNTVTGTVYKDDTNILGWELMNEPPITAGSSKSWIVEMSDYVRANDSNHLVGIALGGMEMSAWDVSSSAWNELDTPELDFIDLHYYAGVDQYYPSVNPDNVGKLESRIAKVQALGKPAVLGEFGLTTDHSLAEMEALYGTVMDAAIAQGAAGIMPYAWGPPGPDGWGGTGGYDIDTDDTALCALVKSKAP